MTTDAWPALARELANEDPSIALTEWDKNRSRSQQTKNARKARKYGVGPSDLNGCPRAIQYRENPPEGHVPIERNRNAAVMGTFIHAGMNEARRFRYPWREFNVKIQVPGLDVPGEADEYDPLIGRVTDDKTASVRKWDRNAGDGPPESEWEQVLTYGLGLVAAGRPVVEVELLYVKRDNGQIEPFRRPYDHDAALVAVSKLHAILSGLEDGRDLPRTHSGPTTDVLCRDWCEHVVTCWDLDSVPQGRTPESWDRFGAALPDEGDPDIAEMLADYRTAHNLETTGKATKDELKAILAGVKSGRYGNNTVATRGGNLGKPQDDLAGRVAQLERMIRVAIEQGSVAVLRDPVDLPMPTVRKESTVYLSVNPVRAAIIEAEQREAANA